MRRLKALSSVNDALVINSRIRRHVRPLSTSIYRSSLKPHLITPLHSPSSIRSSLRHLAKHHTRRHESTTTSSSSQTLHKTPLYDLHLAHGAKMVPFGGYYMPVQYSSQSVSQSHHFTRSHASLFDVSHMVQHRFFRRDARKFLENITPASLKAMNVGRGTLSTFLWPTGGIVDDTIITRLGKDEFYVVTNAGCREKDKAFIQSELGKFMKDGTRDLKWETLGRWGLIALQGPLSIEILQEVLAEPASVDLSTFYFGESQFLKFKLPNGKISSPLLVSRGGYTGEDGFEISIPENETVSVTEMLLSTGTPERLRLAGLGARDSLRLEAGMCLYGHDLDDTTTPVEANLSWIIMKRRRENKDFNGAAVILPQLIPKSKGGKGFERRRVGLVVEGAPAREGAEIVDGESGEKVGVVTSGCPSPTLGKNIAMGYVKFGWHTADKEVGVVVRGKTRKALVTKMPFVETKYWKTPPGVKE